MKTMSEVFELVNAANGVMFLRCRAISVPHGFSTRVGGESAGPFESLNLGVSCGDDAAIVTRNRARWFEALGLAPSVMLHQIHGAVVHGVEAPPQETLFGDGLVTANAELPVSVFTADCTPILLHDADSGAVGAVHAGWRGTVAQIARAAVEAFATRYGTRPERLQAAIGPAIGPCCLEVGPEVGEAAAQSAWPGWERAVIAKAPKAHFDLFAANRDQLRAAGLPESRIHVSGLCTVCRSDLFYSWRRDQAHTGRMIATIAGARA